MSASSGESPPPGNSDLKELDRVKKEFHAERKPIVEMIQNYSEALETCGKKLKDAEEKPEEEMKIRYLTKQMANLYRLIDESEYSIETVEQKYLPNIQKLERRVQDVVSNCGKINKRLKAVAENMAAKSKSFSKLAENEGLSLLEMCGYGEFDGTFEFPTDPVDDATFVIYDDILKRFLRVMPIGSADLELKRKWLTLPIFICALEGLEGFEVNLEVQIYDDFSKLGGKADIVISYKNIEIIVIEAKRGDGQQPTESGIPQALVEMDCLSKKRLLKKRAFGLGKLDSFGVVTDCISWYFLKLDTDGNYVVSECTKLPAGVIGQDAEKAQLHGFCNRIRGLVKEATKIEQPAKQPKI